MNNPSDVVIFKDGNLLLVKDPHDPVVRSVETMKVKWVRHLDGNEAEANLNDPDLWIWMYCLKETSAFMRRATLGGWVSSDDAGQIRFPVDLIIGEVVMPSPIGRQTGHQENINQATVATEVFYNGLGADELFECDWYVLGRYKDRQPFSIVRRY